MSAAELGQPTGTDRPAIPSLWEPIERGGGRPDHLRFWTGTDFAAPMSTQEWHAAAARFAGGLRRAGVQSGDRVACLLTNTPHAAAAVLGTWMAGATLVSLPLLARGMDGAQYAGVLQRILDRVAPVAVLADGELLGLLTQLDLRPAPVAYESLGGGPPVDPELAGPDEPILIQFSSGSTSEPRGCVVTQRAIAYQVSSLARRVRLDTDRDIGVGWLPLSHDMGLIGGLLLTYWVEHRAIISPPQRFIMNPASWLDDCAAFGATTSYAPNFALNLVARAAARRPPPPLALRSITVGGDQVDPQTIANVTSVLGPDQLPAEAITPAYGLAEATLGVTMGDLDRAPSTLRLSADALGCGDLEVWPGDGAADGRATTLVGAGTPLEGTHVEIAAPVGAVGEVLVRSPSLAQGYLADREATDAKLGGGVLRTGDHGVIVDGELFLVGRTDDLIAVGGRNVYARDIEAAIAGVRGLRAGACAVVDVGESGRRRLVAVVEAEADLQDHQRAAREVGAVAQGVAGVRVVECHFVPRGRLPKTSSGKLQRYRCRQLAAAAAPEILRVAT